MTYNHNENPDASAWLMLLLFVSLVVGIIVHGIWWIVVNFDLIMESI